MTTRRKPLVQPKVRLRGDLHKRLSQAAKKAGHSLNQEIALRLDQSFSREDQASATEDLKQFVKWQLEEAVRAISTATAGINLHSPAQEEFERRRKAKEEQEK